MGNKKSKLHKDRDGKIFRKPKPEIQPYREG